MSLAAAAANFHPDSMHILPPGFAGHTHPSLFLTLQGDPVAEARPRINGRRLYFPSARARRQVQRRITAMYAPVNVTGPIFGSDVPLQVNIEIFIRRPVRPPRTPYPRRTDVDNHAKFVLDVLQGVVYENDRDVVTLNVEKRYSDTHVEGYTTVEVLEVSFYWLIVAAAAAAEEAAAAAVRCCAEVWRSVVSMAGIA